MTLNNGIQMPPIGMGTYPLRGKALRDAVRTALGAGYRMFDTAFAYGNESDLGSALRSAFEDNLAARGDVFIISKIGETLDRGIPSGDMFYRPASGGERDVRTAVRSQLDGMLSRLGVDALDLALLHWPFPDYLMEIWGALEQEYRAGRVRAIGVSNCRERHLERLLVNCEIPPMVNQVELHPLNTKKALICFCFEKGIQPQAYSPLMSLVGKWKADAGQEIVLKRLAENRGKSPAQIILRWHVQQGIVPLPKSADPKRLRDNIDIFDFELSPQEMADIDSLNKDYSALVESKYCPGY